MAAKTPSNGNQDIVRLENARKIYQMGTEEVRALAGVSIAFQKGSF